MPLSPKAADILAYAIVALTLSSAGMGLVRLARVSMPRRTAWLLGPALTQALWAAFLAGGVSLGIPVRALAPPLWIFTAALAVIGLGHPRDTSEGPGPLVILCLFAPVLVLLPFFAFGLAEYPGSRHPDAWSDAVYGQCLWERACRGTLDVEPLYQWAAHLAHTRHVSSAELGLLSVLSNQGDTQAASSLFLAICVYTLSTACSAIAVVRRLPVYLACVFVAMVAVSGWVENAVLVANYDNLLAAALFAGTVCAAMMLEPSAQGGWLLLALGVTGLLYTYPELGIVASGIVVIMAAERVWRHPDGKWVAHAALAAVVVGVLLAPYARTMVDLFQAQMATGLQQGWRSGDGNFDGLLHRLHAVSGFWALGGEHAYVRLVRPRTAVALVLFTLLILGVWRLVRDRELGLLAALSLPLVAAPILLVRQGYAYGAYKMIFISWWALCFTVVSVASRPRSPQLVAGAVVVLAVASCLAVPTVALARAIRDVLMAPPIGMSAFRSVEQLPAIVGGAPVGLFVENPEASQWALYFLRTSRTRVGDFDGYLAMSHVRPNLEQMVRIPWKDIHLVLTDATDPGPIVETQGWTPVWRGGAYRLWDTQGHGWAIATDVTTPYGIEQLGGAPFFWMGGGATSVRLIAGGEGCLRVATDLLPGPRSSRPDGRAITIDTAAGVRRKVTLVSGANRFSVPIADGVNSITMVPDDPADLPPPPADPRILIAGLSHLETTFSPIETTSSPMTVRLGGVDNPNGVERLEGVPFFWVGGGPSVVRVVADAPGEVSLTADLVAGPSLGAEASTRRLRVAVPARGVLREMAVRGGSWTVRLPVAAGQTAISLEALDAPTVTLQPNGDRRPLLIGVRNLEVASQTAIETCR